MKGFRFYRHNSWILLLHLATSADSSSSSHVMIFIYSTFFFFCQENVLCPNFSMCLCYQQQKHWFSLHKQTNHSGEWETKSG